MDNFIAYYRVSTAKQGESGLGLDAQRRSVTDFIARTGVMIGEYTEVESGKHDNRPVLRDAIRQCKLTGARLLIAKLDRLSRDVHFLTGLEKDGIDFVAADMPMANRLTVHILAAVAQAEREAISQRTKSALTSIKVRLAAGEEYISKRSGRRVTRLGSPTGTAPISDGSGPRAAHAKAQAFADRVGPTVRALRDSPMTLKQVAAQLNATHVKAPNGETWTAMTVSRVLART